MVRTEKPKVVKAVAAGIMIYYLDPSWRNEYEWNFTELEYIFADDKKQHYRSYESVSKVDFCPLYGLYISCQNCPGRYSDGKINTPESCQHPDMVLIEYRGKLYRAFPIDNDEN
jgi:hypothetical protein